MVLKGKKLKELFFPVVMVVDVFVLRNFARKNNLAPKYCQKKKNAWVFMLIYVMCFYACLCDVFLHFICDEILHDIECTQLWIKEKRERIAYVWERVR